MNILNIIDRCPRDNAPKIRPLLRSDLQRVHNYARRNLYTEYDQPFSNQDPVQNFDTVFAYIYSTMSVCLVFRLQCFLLQGGAAALDTLFCCMQ